MANSPLVNDIVWADPSNYTSGRRNTKIDTIFAHHMAGVLTAKQCGSIFARAGRGGSAHYGIGSDGRIGLYVDEGNIAWHCGNWPWNCRSIGIEMSNSATGGDWPVSAQTLELMAQLCADVAKRNNMGRLVVGQNFKMHKDVAATVCPGPTVQANMQNIADRANEINYPPAPVTPELVWTKFDSLQTYICNKQPTTLWNFNSTTWAGCTAVKEFKKGDRLDIYGSVYNKSLDATYLLTEYSFTKGITNGFNKADLDKVIQPAPEPEPTPEPEPEPTPEPEPEPEPTPEPDPTVGILQKIIEFIQHIIDLITKKEK